ncbi:MAG: hypothetical protein H7Y88_13225 [Phycisphaerales bacterium]|nr:hypothetical protein [Phycisphaerales bacterium]
MSTSKQTFDQVKNILGKLDRNIEDARARRLRGLMPATAALIPAVAPVEPAIAPLPLPTHNGQARPLRAMPKQATPAFRYPDSR